MSLLCLASACSLSNPCLQAQRFLNPGWIGHSPRREGPLPCPNAVNQLNVTVRQTISKPPFPIRNTPFEVWCPDRGRGSGLGDPPSTGASVKPQPGLALKVCNKKCRPVASRLGGMAPLDILLPCGRERSPYSRELAAQTTVALVQLASCSLRHCHKHHHPHHRSQRPHNQSHRKYHGTLSFAVACEASGPGTAGKPHAKGQRESNARDRPQD